jgi:hypothetical protein
MNQKKTDGPGERDLKNLEEFKRFLGPLAADYTDEQLRQMQGEMFGMAEILLDLYLIKKERSRGRRLTKFIRELG